MNTRARRTIVVGLFALAVAACDQSSESLTTTAPSQPRYLFDDDWISGNCWGGTCQPVSSGGSYGSLYSQIQAESSRLIGLSTKPLCQNIGTAMWRMLTRGQYFVRIEGPANVNGTMAAGEYQPLDGPFVPNPPGATDNSRNGSIWFARGRFLVAKDGSYSDTIDTIRHETGHTLLDLSLDPSGYTLVMDAGQGGSITAQQLAVQCR